MYRCSTLSDGRHYSQCWMYGNGTTSEQHYNKRDSCRVSVVGKDDRHGLTLKGIIEGLNEHPDKC
jgi:hypothetical protein